MHNGSGTATQQAKYKWTSGDALASNTSDGGAMRIRNCHDIDIRNNRVEYCFRGYIDRIDIDNYGNVDNISLYNLEPICPKPTIPILICFSLIIILVYH